MLKEIHSGFGKVGYRRKQWLQFIPVSTFLFTCILIKWTGGWIGT